VDFGDRDGGRVVDVSRAKAILSDLVRMDSHVINQGVDGNEAQAQKYVADFLTRVGCEVEVFEPNTRCLCNMAEYTRGHSYQNRPNVVGVLKGTRPGRSVILNGHVDTMPPGDIDSWSRDPWGAIVDGDRMYGLGAADMKGGLAAILTAVEYMAEYATDRAGDVIVHCVVDEEGGGNGTLACIERARQGDAAIVCEPTSLHIQPAHMGTDLFNVTVKGKAIHASRREHGVNAIDKAMLIARALQELDMRLQNKRHAILPSPSLVIGTFSGGVAASMVPDHCVIGCDVHYLPEDEQQIRDVVAESIDSVCESDEWLGSNRPVLRWLTRVSSMETPVSSDLVEVMMNAVQVTTGESILSGMVSGCDARLYRKLMGIPVIIFGPGSLDQAHSVDEWVSIREVQLAASSLVQFMCSWGSSSLRDEEARE
jgi:acetylornithine deacetylase